MAIYKFPSYCTIYNYRLLKDKHWYWDTHKQNACFGGSLSNLKGRLNAVEYSILLVKNTNFVKTNRNNYCWMTKHQLNTYLRRIKSIKSFKYKVSDYEDSTQTFYKIDLKIFGTKKEITFVLQCIKRTYEYPFNFVLLQAYKLQELTAYKRTSILNLFNVVWSTYRSNHNTGHSFSGNSIFVKYSYLQEHLPKVLYVTDLYQPGQGVPAKEHVDGISYWDLFPSDTSQWTSEYLFSKMLPYYTANYKLLKQ